MKMRLSIHVTIHTKIFLLFNLPVKALILGKHVHVFCFY